MVGADTTGATASASGAGGGGGRDSGAMGKYSSSASATPKEYVSFLRSWFDMHESKKVKTNPQTMKGAAQRLQPFLLEKLAQVYSIRMLYRLSRRCKRHQLAPTGYRYNHIPANNILSPTTVNHAHPPCWQGSLREELGHLTAGLSKLEEASSTVDDLSKNAEKKKKELQTAQVQGRLHMLPCG